MLDSQCTEKVTKMRFSKKKAIIFDLDGTLIDSGEDLVSAVNSTLLLLNRDTFSSDEIHSWIGNGALLLVKRALSGGDVDDETLEQSLIDQAMSLFLTEYEKNVCVNTTMYSGVRVSLKVLKAQGYKLAIVTNKPIQFVHPILKKLGLDTLFEIILGGSCIEKSKPDPLPLETVCKRFNISPQECVMVGDSKNDILPANALGMDSIGLLYGYNYGENIQDYNPTIVLDDFSDVVGLFSPEANYACAE